MTINKHSLPKRVISLLLAVAIMIGFVPLIDIDLTAFAMTSGKVTLTDDAPQSGENWVWDNENHTLSLYNVIFTDTGTTIDSAIEYTGDETLIINQIGINGIMITSSNDISVIKAKKIKVIGSGILTISQSSGAIFDAQQLEITSGYISSSNAPALNKRQENVTTVSNCVLDIPKAEIMAYAQSDGTAGFIMKSGYVNCETLTPNFSSDTTDRKYKAAEIQSGYLKVDTINGNYDTFSNYYAYIELGKAVVDASVLKRTAAFCQNRTADKTALVNSTLIYSTDDSQEYDTFFRNAAKITTSSDVRIFYQSDDISHAMYYENDTTLDSTTTLSSGDTIVCPNTLDLTAIDNIPEGVTIYCGETLECSGTINGCLIGGQKLRLGSENSDTTVGGTGRIYVNSTFKLTGDTTIAEGGAVTITTAPTLNSKQLTINGDLTVYSKNSGAIFNENDTNLTIGENAQIVAATAGGRVFETPDIYSIIYSRAKYAGRIFYGVDNTQSSSGEINLEFPAPYTTTVLYIGSAFDTQLACTDSHAEFFYNLKNSYDAWYTLECTRPFDEDYRDLTVTIKRNSDNTDVTEHFDTIKNSAGLSNEVKVQIRNNDLDVNSGDTFTVSFTKDGFTHEQTLTAVAPNFTLDFTKDTNPTSPATPVWNYCGAFYGTNTPYSSATIGDKKVWEWHPDGTEDYPNTKVLVLNGLKFETTADNAIIVPAGTTIVLKGNNDIHSKFTALKSGGSFTIVGETDSSGNKAKLKAYSDYVSRLTNLTIRETTDIAAIWAKNNDITIKNCKLDVKAAGTYDYDADPSGYSNACITRCLGIAAQNITLEGVSGTITAGPRVSVSSYPYNTALGEQSVAICASSKLTINNNCDLTISAYNCAITAPTLETVTLSKLDNAYTDNTLSTLIGKDSYNNSATNGVVTNTNYSIYTSNGNAPTTPTTLKTKSIYTVSVEETGGSGTVELGDYGTNPAKVTYSSTDKEFKADENAWFETTVTAPATGGYYIQKLSITDGSDTYDLIDNSELLSPTSSRSVSAGYHTINSTTGKITSTKLTFAISSDKTLTVEYSNAYYVSCVIPTMHGTVDFGTTDITKPIAAGTTVTATVTPNSGYKISSFRVNGTEVTHDENGKFSFTVTGNTTVEVTFSNVIHTISYGTSSGGTLTFEPDISNGVAEGTTVTATVTPDSGYKLSSVTVDGNAVEVTDNKFTVTVTKDTTIVVTFVKKSSSGGGGSSGGHSSSYPTNTNPTINGVSKSWSDIANELSKLAAGSEVTIGLNGNYDVPVEVIKAIADKDIKATFVIDSWRSWKLDGADIEKPAAADFGAIQLSSSAIDGSSLRGTVGARLRIDGTNNPTTLTISFNKKYAGQFANLYRKDGDKLVFVDTAKIDENGNAQLEITDGGDYIFMLCEYSDRPGDMNNDGKLTAADASAMLKYIVRLIDDGNVQMADLNGDGKINARDAVIVLKKVVGLI